MGFFSTQQPEITKLTHSLQLIKTPLLISRYLYNTFKLSISYQIITVLQERKFMISKNSHHLSIVISLLILISVAIIPVHGSAQIPLTGGWSIESPAQAPISPNLAQFIDQVQNGSTDQITGLYVENLFSYPVIQQPSGQPAYVAPIDNLVTQFSMASSYGSLGFLAHNTMAGKIFPEIINGDIISVVYGDGQFERYQVIQMRSLQAVDPNNPYSSFIDLANNQALSGEDVFYQTYGVSNQLILQTCIAAQGNDSWGRLFVIAVPYTPAAEKISTQSELVSAQ